MFSQWNLHELFEFFAPRVIAAVACGALIGFERELKNKAAGLKTNILICLGATLYTSLSILITRAPDSDLTAGDPGRIAAQIVSGIGFLGGGAIIQARGTVLGLTTAATIWLVAALGVCIGAGQWEVALTIATISLAILTGTSFFEDRILGRSISFACELVMDDPDGSVRIAVNGLLSKHGLKLSDFDLRQRDGFILASIRYAGHRKGNQQFLLELWNQKGVREVRQI